MQELREGDKDTALRFAATVVDMHETDVKRGIAVRFAAEAGASSHEIAAATGLPHATVERLLVSKA